MYCSSHHTQVVAERELLRAWLLLVCPSRHDEKDERRLDLSETNDGQTQSCIAAQKNARPTKK